MLVCWQCKFAEEQQDMSLDISTVLCKLLIIIMLTANMDVISLSGL